MATATSERANTSKIPLLEAADIDCRVQSVKASSKGAVGATLLLYKDARVDMRILDAVFGSFGWQKKYELIGDRLYCTVSCFYPELDTWISKQDVGTESNTEKEKGQASDAFKRACFNWGIGRELYTAPFIWIPLTQGEYYTPQGTKIYRCYSSVKFSVAQIGYNNRREINKLVIVDQNGEVRYEMGKRASAPAAKQAAPAQAPAPAAQPAPTYAPAVPAQQAAAPAGAQIDPATGRMICPECGGAISSDEWRYSESKYGRPMCRKCQNKAKSA